jgi:hypothetical protein
VVNNHTLNSYWKAFNNISIAISITEVSYVILVLMQHVLGESFPTDLVIHG